MSQRNALAALDARLHSAFAAAGMADNALYQAPDAYAPVPCRVYIDRNVQVQGEVVVSSVPRVVVALFKADVREPVGGAEVTLDDETFVLDARVGDDESLSHWVVLT